MKIIATQGPGRFLLDIGPDPATNIHLGQILDTVRSRIYPPHSLVSILARGYWEDAEFSEDETASIMAAVRPSPAA